MAVTGIRHAGWINDKEVARGAVPEAEGVRELERELSGSVEGEVRFDDGYRALYATDASNYRQVPIGVVVPRHVDDVIRAVELCRRHDVPVLARGGGTSLAGQCCNVAVVIDMSKYLNQVLEIDPGSRRARVQPGTILDTLRAKAEGKHSLTFGPDPATHSHCTIGGMLGNNSCGVHSILSARDGGGPRTADNVHELEILTYDGLRLKVGATSDIELEGIIRAGGRRGEIYGRLKSLRDRYADGIRRRFPDIPRRVSGYNLDELLPEKGFNVSRALVGTEGTCVTLLEATLDLIPAPMHRSLVVLGYPSVYEAVDHVMEILAFRPAGLEGIDRRLVEGVRKRSLHTEYLRNLPDGEGWLIVEVDGSSDEQARGRAEELMAALRNKPHAPAMRAFHDRKRQREVWEIRESGLGATARIPGERDTWPGWEDSAVPPERLGEYLRGLRDLFNRYDYGSAALYGHFGQGCIHSRIPFELASDAGVRRYRAFVDEAADLCLRMGGSLSGEHGDGQARAELLEKMYGRDLVQAFREFKAIWDPGWKMNPGKVVDADPITANLRLRANPDPLPVKTYFAYPEDDQSFYRATTRCVGVGKCRRLEGGTMCPSFMATREEMHSTRGRARLLFEMLQGNPLRDQWQSAAVKEALDLCLACKGCKGDCPVNVDMATYKAEFLAHYHQTHARPISAYTMGLIQFWSRLAGTMPGLANFVTQTPGISAIVKRMGGVHPARQLPPYAPETFQQWFRNREPGQQARNQDNPAVLLWPDTFNNHFHPETARSATRVLEEAGFRVEVPGKFLCCGRPLYDYGLLDQARRQLLRILGALRPAIRAGTPIVVLEPSCASVFKDELRLFFPRDRDALRLREQTYLLSDFLIRKAPHFTVPKLHRKAVVHAHCHHKSSLGFGSERELLSRMELDFEVLDSGCCGMAGSFGFERDPVKYDVAMKLGERVLLPKVRAASRDTIIMTDGFSCRTQIEQGSRRGALHVAQVIDMALNEKGAAQPSAGAGYPEEGFRQGVARAPLWPWVAASALVLGAPLLARLLARRRDQARVFATGPVQDRP